MKPGLPQNILPERNKRSQSSMDIDTPIFLVGTGRSGSSFFARIFSHHPELSYLTYITREFPRRPWVTRLAMRILSLPGGRALLRSRGEINEAWEFWEHRARGFAEPMRDLTQADLTPVARERLREAVSDILQSTRPRFFAKLTGWSRMSYLHSVFPDARFIHLVRDGRDVANSFLQISFWGGYRGPCNWRFGPLAEENQRIWESHGRSFVALAGLTWKILVNSVENAREEIPEEQFHEVRFEDFLKHPSREIRSAMTFSYLPWHPKVGRAIFHAEFHDPTGRYKKDLSSYQQETLINVLGDDLKRYGYL